MYSNLSKINVKFLFSKIILEKASVLLYNIPVSLGIFHNKHTGQIRPMFKINKFNDNNKLTRKCWNTNQVLKLTLLANGFEIRINKKFLIKITLDRRHVLEIVKLSTMTQHFIELECFVFFQFSESKIPPNFFTPSIENVS